MKNFTLLIKKVQLVKYFQITLLLFISTAVSYAETPTDSLNKDTQKYLSFYETVDGERIHWEANFFGDEITSIYKNGKKIPDELVTDYKDKVYDQLDEMRFGGNKFTFRMPVITGDDFHIDMEDLNKELEEMKKDLPRHKEHFRFYQFDIKEFEKKMEELKKELEENKSQIFMFKFDEKEFKEQMEQLEKDLKENLAKLKDFKFEFEWEDEDDEI
jgi:septation ring formation regulator EzrA